MKILNKIIQNKLYILSWIGSFMFMFFFVSFIVGDILWFTNIDTIEGRITLVMTIVISFTLAGILHLFSLQYEGREN